MTCQQIKDELQSHLQEFNSNILSSYETLIQENIKTTFTKLFDEQKTKIKNEVIEKLNLQGYL